MKRATISDVASLAGVSIKTVSRVANDEAHVSDATRRKVSAAIRSLDYQADEHARRMGARRRTSAAGTSRQMRAITGTATEAPMLHALSTHDDPLRIDWD